MQRHLQENKIVITDLHLGEGLYKDGKKNYIEYFDADEELCNFIKLVAEKYGDSEADLELVFLGDAFDFLTVEYTWEEINKKGEIIKKGRTLAEPTEDAAIQKIKKILWAHKEVVFALQDFLKYGKIKFFIGNHDLPLVWPGVQEVIKEALTAETKGKEKNHALQKIKFVKEKDGFKEVKNGVLFEHGNNSEETCAMPKNLFLTSRLGKPLSAPHLNHPYGNHLLDLANKLATDTIGCKGNYWISRLEPHWYVYLESLFRRPRFVVYATIMWLITPLLHQFTRRWWIRRSAGFIRRLRHNYDAMTVTIWNKVRGRDSSYHAKQLLKENDDIDIIISGHHHVFRYETTEHGTYVNPGAWCVSYVARFPKIELTWKRFKRLEKFFKKLLAARRLFNKKTRHLHMPKKQVNCRFVLCKFYSDGYKEVDLMHYDPETNCLEKLN